MRLAAAAAILLASCTPHAKPHAIRAVSVPMITSTSARPSTTARAARTRATVHTTRLAAPVAVVTGPNTARATWYSTSETGGHRTASGEPLNDGALTFAHRSMKFGTRVRFCRDGRCAIGRCTDRGPAAWTGKTFDFTRALFSTFAPLGAGVVTVSWEVV